MLRITYFLLLVFAVTISSCEPTGPYDTRGFYQYTPEEVSYLYLDKDSFHFKKDFEFSNSVSFLLNDSTNYNAEVKTSVTSYVHWAYIDPKMSLYGLSSLYFPEIFTFNRLTVGVYREFNSADYTLHIGVGSTFTGLQFFKNIVQPTFDTAMVSGEVYQDVCKIVTDSTENSYIKSIYFAKKFGFIQIECTNGSTLKLIKPLYTRM